MNQVSQVPFSTKTDVLAGYAHAGGDRLGNFDLVFENTGLNAVTIAVKQLNAAGTAYDTTLTTTASIVPGGTLTKSLVVVGKRIGFFTSAGGNTQVNISTAQRNKGDLRGAQIDIVAGGQKGWGMDTAFDVNTTKKKWGAAPDEGQTGVFGGTSGTLDINPDVSGYGTR